LVLRRRDLAFRNADLILSGLYCSYLSVGIRPQLVRIEPNQRLSLGYLITFFNIDLLDAALNLTCEVHKLYWADLS